MEKPKYRAGGVFCTKNHHHFLQQHNRRQLGLWNLEILEQQALNLTLPRFNMSQSGLFATLIPIFFRNFCLCAGEYQSLNTHIFYTCLFEQLL